MATLPEGITTVLGLIEGYPLELLILIQLGGVFWIVGRFLYLLKHAFAD